MPTTTFRTVNGRILGHNKAGVASEYLLDPLGSVIGTSTSAGVVSNRTTYWPYGEVRTGGVSSVTPFGFCGGWGYYTGSPGRIFYSSDIYRPTLATWESVGFLRQVTTAPPSSLPPGHWTGWPAPSWFPGGPPSPPRPTPTQGGIIVAGAIAGLGETTATGARFNKNVTNLRIAIRSLRMANEY
jgi:hypothetical protein